MADPLTTILQGATGVGGIVQQIVSMLAFFEQQRLAQATAADPFVAGPSSLADFARGQFEQTVNQGGPFGDPFTGFGGGLGVFADGRPVQPGEAVAEQLARMLEGSPTNAIQANLAALGNAQRPTGASFQDIMAGRPGEPFQGLNLPPRQELPQISNQFGLRGVTPSPGQTNLANIPFTRPAELDLPETVRGPDPTIDQDIERFIGTATDLAGPLFGINPTTPAGTVPAAAAGQGTLTHENRGGAGRGGFANKAVPIGLNGLPAPIDPATGLPSLQVGTSFVPSDQIVKVHKGEQIIPPGGVQGSQQFAQQPTQQLGQANLQTPLAAQGAPTTAPAPAPAPLPPSAAIGAQQGLVGQFRERQGGGFGQSTDLPGLLQQQAQQAQAPLQQKAMAVEPSIDQVRQTAANIFVPVLRSQGLDPAISAQFNTFWENYNRSLPPDITRTSDGFVQFALESIRATANVSPGGPITGQPTPDPDPTTGGGTTADPVIGPVTIDPQLQTFIDQLGNIITAGGPITGDILAGLQGRISDTGAADLQAQQRAIAENLGGRGFGDSGVAQRQQFDARLANAANTQTLSNTLRTDAAIENARAVQDAIQRSADIATGGLGLGLQERLGTASLALTFDQQQQQRFDNDRDFNLRLGITEGNISSMGLQDRLAIIEEFMANVAAGVEYSNDQMQFILGLSQVNPPNPPADASGETSAQAAGTQAT